MLTSEWVTEQLISVGINARSQEKPDSAGANKVLHLLGLELGMFVKREETGKPGEFDNLTIAAKREPLRSIALQLGLHRIRDGQDGPRDHFTVPNKPTDAGPTDSHRVP